MRSYLKKLGNATSQWLNAASDGNPDIPMSARVGYYAAEEKRNQVHGWFRLLEYIIDLTFYPIDGERHCWYAYISDRDEQISEGTFWSFLIMTFFVLIGCLIVGTILWVGYGFYKGYLLLYSNH